jgi:hypothetical protein
VTAPADDLSEWLARISGPEWLWHVKYVSANDTYAKPNVHQAGPYIGKETLARAFPRLTHRADREQNPDAILPALLVADRNERDVRLVWYNSDAVQLRHQVEMAGSRLLDIRLPFADGHSMDAELGRDLGLLEASRDPCELEPLPT